MTEQCCSIVSVPSHLSGMWGHWDVRDEIDENLDLDSPGLDTATGLFLGFGSGDRKEWAKRLPKLRNLKYLVSWTGNNPQSLFDSIAEMSWLKRLCFGRLSAKDISGLSELQDLEYLCIHQLSGPSTLQPIMDLENLCALELGLNNKITDLERFFENRLRTLRSIIIYANKARIDIPSIKPLAAVSSLEYISIPTVRAADEDLQSLANLPNLKFLHLAKSAWPQTELDAIKAKDISIKLGF